MIYSEKEYNSFKTTIENMLDGRSFVWNILNKEVEFVSSIHGVFQERKGLSESILTKAYKEYLTLHPENKKVQQKLFEKENKKTVFWMITVCLIGDIDAEIDLVNNTLIFPEDKRYSLEEIVEKDLCVAMLYYRLNEEFYEQLKQYILGFQIAIMLSSGSLSEFMNGKYCLYLNDIKYKEEHIMHNHYDVFNSSSIPCTTIDITNCWKWLCNIAKVGDEEAKPPVYFTALTYIINRYDYEAFMFAVLGLDSLFAPNKGNIIQQFKDNINAVFSDLDKNTLKRLYQMRSKFVHGDKEFSIVDSYLGFNNDPTLDDSIELAGAILVEAIRILIKNNSSQFKFDTTVSYSFL